LKSEHRKDVAGKVLSRRALCFATLELDRLRAASHANDHQLGALADERRISAEGNVVELIAILGLALRRDFVPRQCEQSLRLGNRQRAPQHRVDQTEGGRRRADGETEREDRGGGGRAMSAQLPDGKHDVREDRL
jgi:hypothetical protein